MSNGCRSSLGCCHSTHGFWRMTTPEMQSGGFSSQQAQRLKYLGLTSRHIDALARHALPMVRQHVHPPSSQEVKTLLQNLENAPRALQDAICAVRHPGAIEMRKSQRPPAASSRHELRQRMLEKLNVARFSMNLLTSVWAEATSNELTPSADPDAASDDFLTPLHQLDRLNAESHSLELLARAALAEHPGQARKTVGNPKPVLEIWRVIERTDRNLEELRSVAGRQRKALPPQSTLAPPWKRGSRFGDVVDICYVAAGYLGRPKNALLAAKRSLKSAGVGADGKLSKRKGGTRQRREAVGRRRRANGGSVPSRRHQGWPP